MDSLNLQTSFLNVFHNKKICIRQSDGTSLKGVGLSIDSYLNVILGEVEYLKEGDLTNYEIMFVRGSFVESISLE
jgi:small nuclear ribonucleoprotein (snRNP)-like protein